MKAFLSLVVISTLLMSASMAPAQTVPSVMAPQPAAHVIVPAPVPAAPVSTNVGGLTTGDVVYTYHLGSGDKVKISVYGEPDLGGTVAVTGDGKISLPLIGEVQAAGMTPPQLQSAIEAIYRQGYLKDPKVNVEVLNFRPFYILGEVKLPGEYPYDNGMTVVKAVALAQGFTYRADQKKVFIKHINDNRELQVPLTSTQTVEPGDTIRIAERYF